MPSGAWSMSWQAQPTFSMFVVALLAPGARGHADPHDLCDASLHNYAVSAKAVHDAWRADRNCTVHWNSGAAEAPPTQCVQGFCGYLELILTQPVCKEFNLARHAPAASQVDRTSGWAKEFGQFCAAAAEGGFHSLDTCSDPSGLRQAAGIACGAPVTCERLCNIPGGAFGRLTTEQVLSVGATKNDISALCRNDQTVCLKTKDECRYARETSRNADCYLCRCQGDFDAFFGNGSSAPCKFSRCVNETEASCQRHRGAATCVTDRCSVQALRDLMAPLPAVEKACVWPTEDTPIAAAWPQERPQVATAVAAVLAAMAVT